MNTIKRKFKEIIKDESGQGMAEYILLVVIVVGIVTAFKKPLTDAITNKVSALSSSITDF